MIDAIKILPSKEIDKAKWDACVRRNENGLIYARSFYLDAIASNWDGLIVNDYEAVMPLTWKKKFGIKYLSREMFVQQLGIIGKIENAEMPAVIDFALKPFKWYGAVAFNFLNDVSFLNGTQKQINFVLDLNKSYQEIFKNFVPSLQRNIRKARKNNLQIMEAPAEEAINERQKLSVALHGKEVKITFTRFKKFASDFPDFVVAKKIISSHGELLTTALFLKDERRIYGIMFATMPAGKAFQAMPFLLDNIMQEYCGQNLLFDFEGSNLSGVKKFCEKFSPINQPYFLYQYNHLPRIARLLKRLLP